MDRAVQVLTLRVTGRVVRAGIPPALDRAVTVTLLDICITMVSFTNCIGK